jgi:NADH-quinone oxidoreductase subunit E
LTVLKNEEKKEIEERFPHYATKRAVCVEALKVLQRHRGWVDDEAIADISAFLEMTPDELDAVATYYNMIFRKPVGRHVILLCDSVSCWIMGANRLCERLSGRLGIKPGETTVDNRFTLLPSVCLGACDHAPVLMVDNDTHGDLTPEKIDDLLDHYKKEDGD